MFMAYLVQKGEGCGYMISCGKTMFILKAKNREDALKEIEKLVKGSEAESGFTADNKQELYECILIEGTKEVMPLKKWYKEIEDEEKKSEEKEKEDKERAEFLRLQKKFKG